MIAGLIAGLGTFFEALFMWTKGPKDGHEYECRSRWCIKEGLIVLILPICWYIIKMIGQYDQRLQEKQLLINQRKKELEASYKTLINDMDGLLSKSAESSSLLAERSFESKKRDFQKFLEKAESRFSKVVITSEDDQRMIVDQFRRFIQRWLDVFAECSIDPINCPKIMVSQEEMSRCTTIREITTLTLDRLKATQVKFVSTQRAQDEKMVSLFRRKALGDKRETLRLPSSVERIDLDSHTSFADLSDSESRKAQSRKSVSGGNKETCCQRNCGCGWCLCGTYGCGTERSADPTGFPCAASCKCAKMVILSRDHVTMFVAVLASIGILCFEIFDHSVGPSKPQCIVAISIFLVAVIVMLFRFEQIDIIQRLEVEVQTLTVDAEQVQERREKMIDFWDSMQKLTDIWLHRTVPRLDLMKEVQGHLEDAKDEDVLPYTANANRHLEELEKYLGDLKLWKKGGALNDDAKKEFGNRIAIAANAGELPQILHELSGVVHEGLLRVEDAQRKTLLSPDGPAITLTAGSGTGRPSMARSLTSSFNRGG